MKYVADKDGHWIPYEVQTSDTHYVQPDLAEFHSNDGTRIGGRAQWKEHLKRTGLVEYGHADIQQSVEKQRRREAALIERANRKVEGVNRNVEPPPLDERHDYKRSRLNNEVKNKLEGRPMPDRVTLIKLTLDTARDLDRRR